MTSLDRASGLVRRPHDGRWFPPKRRSQLLWLTVFVAGGYMAIVLADSSDAPARGIAAREWERFSPALVDSSRRVSDLQHAVEIRAGTPLASLPAREAMASLFGATAERFTHGPARYTLRTNWVLAPLGPVVGHIEDPEDILRYSFSALCGQAASVLMRLADRVGIEARLVALGGHVVMEAHYDGSWHMYDPDLEVLPEIQGHVLSVEELAGSRTLVNHFYGHFPNAARIEAIFLSKGDNMSLNSSTLLSPRLATMKGSLHRVRWLVPWGMLLISACHIWVLMGPANVGSASES